MSAPKSVASEAEALNGRAEADEASDGFADDTAGTAQPALGIKLRELRLERSLSLKEVAVATGISVSFLSVVENGRSDITIGRLMRLLAFYGASVADLLADGNGRDQFVVRKGEEIILQSPAEGVEILLLARDTNRAMMPIMGIHEPGATLTDLRPHNGETFVHMLEGSILVEREGHPPLVLSAGDSAYWRVEGVAPVISTVGPEQARLVAVVTPPTL
jgi:transcriptional regulator with XRE-family HTH domain